MRFLFCIALFLLFACRQADETRLNRLTYTVSSVSALPIDTASRFDVSWQDEGGNVHTDSSVHRFSYTFSVLGEGHAYLSAISLDSVYLEAVILLNGNLLKKESGYSVTLEAPFH